MDAYYLEQIENIDFWQDMCSGIIVENNVVKGVQTSLGIEILSKTVILTNGTFLNGLIHLGEKQFGGIKSCRKSFNRELQNNLFYFQSEI